MNRKDTYNRVAQLIVILVCAFTLKHLYSTASVNELRWILAPTTTLVELVTGASFNFESHAGYLSGDRSFLIAGSCAGVNFMIAAFLMLSLIRLWRVRLSWKFIPAALLFAYAATIVANTVRISTALQLQQTPFEISWLSSNQLHRLEGILIYFGFLLLLFLVTEQTSRVLSLMPQVQYQSEPNLALVGVDPNVPSGSNNLVARLRQFVFPLLIYYATTLGMPLANTAYRREIPADAFLEHSAFVLLAPLALIVPLTIFRLFSHAGTDALLRNRL
jgi:exosortase K